MTTKTTKKFFATVILGTIIGFGFLCYIAYLSSRESPYTDVVAFGVPLIIILLLRLLH